jgi:hypothetical protein
MITFDAPTRDFCTVERQKTSTPLQSLVLLNDPQFYNAAKAIAEKITVESDAASDTEKIQKLFRTITLRKPSNEEKKLLNDYYDTLREDSSEPDQNPLVDLALLIYNLDETTQKS